MSNVGKAWTDVLRERPEAYSPDQFALGTFARFRRSPWLHVIRNYDGIKPGGQVLEAGCGGGKFSLALATWGYQVTALDYSTQMLANVRELQTRVEAIWGPLTVKWVQGDVEHLGFATGVFDLTLNEGVIEHWLDAEQRLAVLRETVRVTRPGGIVAVFVPNGRHPLHGWWERTGYPGYQAPPMTLYDAKTLGAELAEAGCQDVVTDGIGAWASLAQWPNWWFLRYFFGLLNRLIPLPRQVREKWGISLVAMGRAKA